MLVQFDMTWMCSGQQIYNVPDGLTRSQVEAYLQEHKDEIPIPEGGAYVSDSDTLDFETLKKVTTEPSPLFVSGTSEQIAWAKEALHGNCSLCPARDLCRQTEEREKNLPEEERSTCQEMLERSIRFIAHDNCQYVIEISEEESECC